MKNTENHNEILPLSALLGDLLERSWGFFGASWAVLEASWAILAALVASQVRLGSHLGRLGRLGERQGRVWAPTEPRKEGAVPAPGRDREGGGLRKITETLPDSTWHSSTPQRARGHGGGSSEPNLLRTPFFSNVPIHL